nr:SRPBCC family protein [Prochlorococcus sp. MIT 1341]
MERLPNGTRRLAAQLRTPIKASTLWEVLTDYENLNTFIPNLSTSELISRSENKVKLKQVGTQKFVGVKFSAKVQIELTENKKIGDLEFCLLKGDFRRFEGAWRIRPQIEGEGTFLLYELTVQGCLGMPVGLIEQRLREDLSTNLLSVEKEANKREKIFKLLDSD